MPLRGADRQVVGIIYSEFIGEDYFLSMALLAKLSAIGFFSRGMCS